MQLEKSMEKWGACSQSVKTIKMEDFPNASLFLLYHQTKKQLVPALHCFFKKQRKLDRSQSVYREQQQK